MIGIAAAEVDHIDVLVSGRAGRCRSVSWPADLFACIELCECELHMTL